MTTRLGFQIPNFGFPGAPTYQQAEAVRNDFLARRGMNWNSLP